jgi:hypothetical protein
MQHTLIAVFDNRGDAQAAKDELYAAGLSGAEIRQNDATGAAGASGASATAGTSGAMARSTSMKKPVANLFPAASP